MYHRAHIGEGLWNLRIDVFNLGGWIDSVRMRE